MKTQAQILTDIVTLADLKGCIERLEAWRDNIEQPYAERALSLLGKIRYGGYLNPRNFTSDGVMVFFDVTVYYQGDGDTTEDQAMPIACFTESDADKARKIWQEYCAEREKAAEQEQEVKRREEQLAKDRTDYARLKAQFENDIFQSCAG